MADSADDGTDMDIHLATGHLDYYVPFALSKGENAVLRIKGLQPDALCWKGLKLEDMFDTQNREYSHPVYHHTPSYGWMNDANGLFYKDGV